MNMTVFIHILWAVTNLFYIWMLDMLAGKTIGPYRNKKTGDCIIRVTWLIIYMKISDMLYLSFGAMVVIYVILHGLYFIILYSSEVLHYIVGSMYMAVANMLAEAFAYIGLSSFVDFKGELEELSQEFSVFGMVLSKIILFILIQIYIAICSYVQNGKYVKPGNERKENIAFQNRQEKNKVSLLIFFENVLSLGIFCTVLIFIACEVKITEKWFVIFMGIMMLTVALYHQYHHFRINEINKDMCIGQEQLIKVYKNYMDRSDEAWQNIRTARHDMKKQYLLEQAYLENERYEELKKEYERNINILMPRIRISGHPVIDAIISYGVTSAERKNVIFTYDIHIPVDFDIDEYDMNRLLGNIIDNAINAAAKVNNVFIAKSGINIDNSEYIYENTYLTKSYVKSEVIEESKEINYLTNSYVKLTCRYDAGNIYIRCENSCYSDEVIERYSKYKYSTNHEKIQLILKNNLKYMSDQEHGLGIDIILQIVRKYEGTVKTTIEEKKGYNNFILEIVLYICR